MGRVRVNDAEVARLARGEGRYDGVRRDLEERAERVLTQARQLAPVVTGEYRDNLYVQVDEVDGALRVAIAGNSDHDFQVEADYGVLSRALDAAGGA